jgi:hypothetical protein
MVGNGFVDQVYRAIRYRHNDSVGRTEERPSAKIQSEANEKFPKEPGGQASTVMVALKTFHDLSSIGSGGRKPRRRKIFLMATIASASAFCRG